MTIRVLIVACLVVAVFSLFLLGSDNTRDGAAIGVVNPQVVAAVPAAPFICEVSVRGWLIYVDDTNATAESFLCYCGTDADDTTYIWLKAEDPTADCF